MVVVSNGPPTGRLADGARGEPLVAPDGHRRHRTAAGADRRRRRAGDEADRLVTARTDGPLVDSRQPGVVVYYVQRG